MIHLLVIYIYISEIYAAVDVHDIKVPEALDKESYKKAVKVTDNQAYIENELKDQLKKLGELHSSLNNVLHKSDDNPNKKQNTDSMNYNVFTLDSMEAPVIFLEPPMILPKDQIKADKDVENLLKSTGLEKDVENKSSDPYSITSIDEAELAEKSIKSEITKLKQDRHDIFKRMRAKSLLVVDDPSILSDYNALKHELAEKDMLLKREIEKLTQLEHVKAALINKHGAGNDVRAKEEELEDREDELADENDHKTKDDDDDDEL